MRLCVAAFLLSAIGLSKASPAPLLWQEGAGYRWAKAEPLDGGVGFERMDGQVSGIHFTNILGSDRSLTNQVLLNGSGVAAGDMDGDGLVDLYFCGLETPNALYRNLGNWRFEEVAKTAGVQCQGQYSTGAAFADVDGDGDLDLIVNGLFVGARLFVNDGAGRFAERTAEAGLRGRSGAASIALADVDSDGDLDLYIVNYRSETFRDNHDTKFRLSTEGGAMKLLAVDGKPVTDPEMRGRFSIEGSSGILEHGEPDTLYLNNGKGGFTAVGWASGRFRDAAGAPLKEPPYDWGLSAMFHDMNADGAPDLYVCNDFHSEDRIWMNDGRGNFQAAPPLAFRHTSLFSMGVDFGDIDGDGLLDLFVADMLSRDPARRKVQVANRAQPLARTLKTEDRPQYSHNTLFWNRGNGRYSEIAFLAGVEASEWSWSPMFLDVDLDGRQDLLITTGHGADVQNIDVAAEIEEAKKKPGMTAQAKIHLRRKFQPLIYPNIAFRNGGALQFTEAGAEWGFDATEITHGLAAADLDNDGDLDLVGNCLNGRPLLYKNRSGKPRIGVRLRGAGANTQSIGAALKLRDGAAPLQVRQITAGGRYLSGDDAGWSFAMGSATNAVLEVHWPGRRQSEFIVRPNCLYEIHEPTIAAPAPARLSASKGWFQLIATTGGHSEAPYNDWERQPLAPRSLSYEGPALCALDADQDGAMDILVSSGRGAAMTLLRNGGAKGFEARALGRPTARDQVSLIPLLDAQGPLALAGLSNFEDGARAGTAVRLIQVATGRGADILTNFPGALGALALGDADGDGNLDLFVGGRALPGQYPLAAPSVFLKNEDGRFNLVASADQMLGKLGLCTAALWADVDPSPGNELIAATEWGAIRIFKWRDGSFIELTTALGMDQHRGLWQSLAAGDFNGDGRIDIVAGNWGLNSGYKAGFGNNELRLFYSEQAGAGLEVVEALANGSGDWLPLRDLSALSAGMPHLRERFPTFASFSKVSVENLWESGPRSHKSVNTLQSMIFLSTKDGFEARPLNIEAQLSPAMSLLAADFNRDNRLDLFVGQNFFGGHPQDARQDAGFSLILEGQGDGSFRARSVAESGIEIPGEARGVAAADFDKDGWTDLAIGENSGPVRIYRNALGAARR